MWWNPEPPLVCWLPRVRTCDLHPDHLFLSQSSYGQKKKIRNYATLSKHAAQSKFWTKRCDTPATIYGIGMWLCHREAHTHNPWHRSLSARLQSKACWLTCTNRIPLYSSTIQYPNFALQFQRMVLTFLYQLHFYLLILPRYYFSTCIRCCTTSYLLAYEPRMHSDVLTGNLGNPAFQRGQGQLYVLPILHVLYYKYSDKR